MWDNSNIERIDVRLHESIGVESRGSFYDGVGALRDVGQNHVLAMLAAVTMEYPPAMDVASVRKNRTDILTTLAPWTDATLSDTIHIARNMTATERSLVCARIPRQKPISR